MTTLQIELPPKLIPVFIGPARYRCSHGGRGSAKTRSFAKMAAVHAVRCAQEGRDGVILCAREFMNSLDDSSMAEVKAAILSEPWLEANFDVGEKYIRTKGGLPGRVDFKFVGLTRNLDSIKSKAQILLCWVDEAEGVTETAWSKLTPTVREDGSEIWVTWNPENKRSAAHKRFREVSSDDVKVVEMNWRDNPWFPDVLERERQNDLKNRPDQYGHIWEGEFKTIYEGAYYASALNQAKAEGRITHVPLEPLQALRTYHDLGGSSQTADAYTIVVAQWPGKNINVLDYYETEGQQPADHIAWMRAWCIDRGVKVCYINLPHDGSHVQINQSWESLWYSASDDQVRFVVSVGSPLGGGAPQKRITATQTAFHRVWFNEKTTGGLREALSAYHEKRNEDRDIGLGPLHDWSSHGADAFGEMCIQYSEPVIQNKRKRKARAASKWAM